ncbi:metallophosphoesterase [Oscillatoria sp. FACHB-1407]|uniref:metallophosphoesterase family protein n=1 Tax=Oscillatoria sp. FACHB-1407 TaxID=2692847 RepID=UPI0016838CD4|nr:metallophosphoesterase [Oscillatoria sp. FACHB-1407]MBD2464537.1 metallophosphoesterase [Oscillatoria sp. FACHB-1407]
MRLDFRFAIISDPHIALPHTIWDHPTRFHLVEVSIPALEQVLSQLELLDLDFLLLPGDLTQHGEPDNHAWLADRLAQLPYPVYVVPGNHDVVERQASHRSIGVAEFPGYYEKMGYDNAQQIYYSHEIVPGVRLIGLNSNDFDGEGKQLGMGHLDTEQLIWLEQTLATAQEELILVMIHHNVLEHLPGQSKHGMGKRYMLSNANKLLQLLRAAKVPLIFTGHLHVQDIAHADGIYEITTGSLVSYPHPYRVLHFYQDDHGQRWLKVESDRVVAVPDFPDLQQLSREWMGDRSFHFMFKLLSQPPLNLSIAEAEALAPALRYFWAEIANGDALFDFAHFPDSVRRYLKTFSAIDMAGNPRQIDNQALLNIS